MVPKAVAAQSSEKVAECLLADASQPTRGELHSFVVALDESTLLELIGHALQPREIAGGVLTEDVAQGLLGRSVERLTAVHTAKSALQLLDGLQAIHDTHRLIERQLLVPEESVSLPQVPAVGEQFE